MTAAPHVTGVESAVIHQSFTAIRSVPPLFRCVLPFTDWQLTSPASSTEELLLAERPSLRVSVKWMGAPEVAPPQNEHGWFDLWRKRDGLVIAPGAELQTERTATTPKAHSLLDRRGYNRKNPVDAVWQIVAARPTKQGCLYFVLLSNWGPDPMTDDSFGMFVKVADSFDLHT